LCCVVFSNFGCLSCRRAHYSGEGLISAVGFEIMD
jgi:hypothetical protein